MTAGFNPPSNTSSAGDASSLPVQWFFLLAIRISSQHDHRSSSEHSPPSPNAFQVIQVAETAINVGRALMRGQGGRDQTHPPATSFLVVVITVAVRILIVIPYAHYVISIFFLETYIII